MGHTHTHADSEDEARWQQEHNSLRDRQTTLRQTGGGGGFPAALADAEDESVWLRGEGQLRLCVLVSTETN